ncbi:hypothetical protein BO79DRAFT_219514 [Aspergillus costaricaensis CBS 115574]|uniref:Uncharacterized protein n=1 Tax=Aspergillus costaricaensis CBS 115574 TaxID=1448317 RepID=A0ACD1I9N2_9EURO|nr:hypothetical protein BO79DRAFT_219514 [Aspergillus costaricaensis CBS 115574]RAK87030.1 hypothetical protein BO79DRAFT_219514 [Aspergillus costaricaensis CBS 115574]
MLAYLLTLSRSGHQKQADRDRDSDKKLTRPAGRPTDRPTDPGLSTEWIRLHGSGYVPSDRVSIVSTKTAILLTGPRFRCRQYTHTSTQHTHTQSTCSSATMHHSNLAAMADRQTDRIIGDTTTPTMYIITQTKYVLCTMYYIYLLGESTPFTHNYLRCILNPQIRKPADKTAKHRKHQNQQQQQQQQRLRKGWIGDM